jgi:hypothetical protein
MLLQNVELNNFETVGLHYVWMYREIIWQLNFSW